MFSLCNLCSYLFQIGFPKFTLEETSNLNDVLPKLGVTDVFDDKKADLTGIASLKTNLHINKILHKVVLQASRPLNSVLNNLQ